MKDPENLQERLLKHAKDIISIDRATKISDSHVGLPPSHSIGSLEQLGEATKKQPKIGITSGKSIQKDEASNVIPLIAGGQNKK